MGLIHRYPIIIKEQYLDSFGHLNNAAYLTLFEEARWDLITHNGYGFKRIQATQEGPTILEIQLKFLKELRLRDEVMIETISLSYEKKIGQLSQKMLREGVVCCEALFVIGFFSLKERKLITPPQEWLQALQIT